MRGLRAAGIGGLLLLALSTNGAHSEQHFVVADYVKVRTRADPKAAVIAILPLGTTVAIEKDAGAGWVSIRFDADAGSPGAGYVRAEFLQPQYPTVDQIRSKAMDHDAPLDARVTWLERWLVLEPDDNTALVALRDAYVSSGKVREAEQIESRLAGDFPIHLGVCALRRPFQGGSYPFPIFDPERRGDAFVLVASITSRGIVDRVGAEGRAPALTWAQLPWQPVPWIRIEKALAQYPIPFHTPRAAGVFETEDEAGMSSESGGGYLELGSRYCREGQFVASTVLRAASQTLADWRNTPRWRQLMGFDQGSDPSDSHTISAQTVVLGQLRLTSVRIGTRWALFDEQSKMLHVQGWGVSGSEYREDVGEVQWLTLPGGKRLLAVAQYRRNHDVSSRFDDGVTLLVVGSDRRVQAKVILLAVYLGG